ncbi:RNA polymerase sigma-70 factor, ECF subfamily [Actinoplanes philippinensis]|uniref:RNA polymerase sigma-70 factor, ECF subfamily n=2 Tax=Actinoplanes philippinensis TaxID=35752 RepID=A0A1I2FZ35_9ACTN|nr:RNA polymerase sigma-70 factor, ECF subfamily [Actinoplanes philippinensis]
MVGMSKGSAAEDAVSELYRSCYARLVGVVALAAQSRVDGEECVQEAFLKLLGRWDHVSRLESPEIWVRTVAFRLLSNRRRKARNAVRALLRHGPAPAEPEPSADRVDVAHALRRLSLGQRQVVVMHHLLGLGVEEIAGALQIAPGTVKSRLSRGRAVLAELLPQEASHA